MSFKIYVSSVIYLCVAVAENNTQRKYAIISISYIVTGTRSQPEAGVIRVYRELRNPKVFWTCMH